MTFDPPLDHDALLTLARKTEAAAHDGARDHLETAALHLCHCDNLAQQLSAQLSLQAADERLAGVATRRHP